MEATILAFQPRRISIVTLQDVGRSAERGKQPSPGMVKITISPVWNGFLKSPKYHIDVWSAIVGGMLHRPNADITDLDGVCEWVGFMQDVAKLTGLVLEFDYSRTELTAKEIGLE